MEKSKSKINFSIFKPLETLALDLESHKKNQVSEIDKMANRYIFKKKICTNKSDENSDASISSSVKDSSSSAIRSKEAEEETVEMSELEKATKPKKKEEKKKTLSLDKKKKEKFNREEDIKELVSLSKPLRKESKGRKGIYRFCIKVCYLNKLDQEKHRTIIFGLKDKAFFIDHRDKIKRNQVLGRERKEPSIFSKEFYEKYLLNGEYLDLERNFSELIKKIF